MTSVPPPSRPGREKFGPEITCRTGEYRDDKVPSDQLHISLKYGKRTTTVIDNTFQYLENPIQVDVHPRDSFKWSVCYLAPLWWTATCLIRFGFRVVLFHR